MARRRKRPTTKAVLSAAHQLGIDDDDAFARVMRCSVETVRRYRSGDELARIEFHLQTSWLLIDTVRLVRERRLPGQTTAQWLAKPDEDLGMCPGDLLTEDWGLDRLHDWLAGPAEGMSRIGPQRRPRSKRRPSPNRYEPADQQLEPPRPSLVVEPKVEEGTGGNWWRLVAGGAAAVGATVVGAVLWVARTRR